LKTVLKGSQHNEERKFFFGGNMLGLA